MSEEKLKEIADNADMIVRGYAFTKKDKNISVLNLKTGLQRHQRNGITCLRFEVNPVFSVHCIFLCLTSGTCHLPAIGNIFNS